MTTVDTCTGRDHTYGAYSKGRCRCPLGREAARLYRQQQRARRLTRPGHGVAAMYDAGCRCWDCRIARTTRRIAAKARGQTNP